MRLIFIGDSLIEFFDWAARFPSHEVHNLGRAGETAEEMFDRLQRVVRAHPGADKVFIMSGINNISMEDYGIIGPYRESITYLKYAYPKATLYVHSLLPTLLPWIPAEEIVRMNGLLSDLAARHGAQYIDVHSLFVERGAGRCLLDDGIHISEEGYAIWSSAHDPIITPEI